MEAADRRITLSLDDGGPVPGDREETWYGGEPGWGGLEQAFSIQLTNDRPTAIGTALELLEDEADHEIEVFRLAVDAEAFGALLPASSFSVIAEPAEGAFAWAAETAIATYSPPLNYFGNDLFFVFEVCDNDDGDQKW